MQGTLPAMVPILPGDTIVVSKAGIVYVVGDVHQPSSERHAIAGVVLTRRTGGIRVLGAVLKNREFPIPENLYAKL
jgi:hypothetical protein